MYMRLFIIYLKISGCFGHANMKKLTIYFMFLKFDFVLFSFSHESAGSPHIIAHVFGAKIMR